MKLIPKMLGDVIRNIFRYPYTVPYPKKKVTPPERFRGMIEITDACIACGACAVACPAKCIKFDRKSLVYWLPHCISCGRCADVCPVDAVKFTHEYEVAREDKELYAKKIYEMAKCSVCGKEFMPLVQKKHMIEVKNLKPELFEKCPACKMATAPKKQEAPYEKELKVEEKTLETEKPVEPEIKEEIGEPKTETKEEKEEPVGEQEKTQEDTKEAEKTEEKEEPPVEKEYSVEESEKETPEKKEENDAREKEEVSEEKEEPEVTDNEKKEDIDEIGDGKTEGSQEQEDTDIREESDDPTHEDVFGGVEHINDEHGFEDAPPWVRREE